jgi:ABC-type polysaccharide/polyol phosphate export permease
MPAVALLLYSAGAGLALLVVGYLIFKNQERRFADVI